MTALGSCDPWCGPADATYRGRAGARGGGTVGSTEFDDEDRWIAEGGHEPLHVRRARLLDELASAGEAQRADLWETAAREFGEHEASRIWQEGLSSSDASET